MKNTESIFRNEFNMVATSASKYIRPSVRQYPSAYYDET